MQTVGIFDIKTNISALLKRVENGEQIGISRRGKPIARLVPEPAEIQYPTSEEMLAWSKQLREDCKGAPMTWDEFTSARDEGRR